MKRLTTWTSSFFNSSIKTAIGYKESSVDESLAAILFSVRTSTDAISSQDTKGQNVIIIQKLYEMKQHYLHNIYKH